MPGRGDFSADQVLRHCGKIFVGTRAIVLECGLVLTEKDIAALVECLWKTAPPSFTEQFALCEESLPIADAPTIYHDLGGEG